PLAAELLPVLFSECTGDRRDPHSFPTRRSSDLQRQRLLELGGDRAVGGAGLGIPARMVVADDHRRGVVGQRAPHHLARVHLGAVDRKSTRLNSSHVKISYAVFCLKKKKAKELQT